jgi:DNA-binding cell septation regulator SpoVG
MENNGLKITKISVYPVTGNSGRLRANVSIVLNDCLHLTSLKVYDGSGGLFVSYPVEHTKKGEDFRQIFYPVKKELREFIEDRILFEYSVITEEVV